MLLLSPDPTPLADAQHRIRALGFLDPDDVRRLEAAATVYHRTAPRWGLHWTWVFAQALLETDYGRSAVCRTYRNWAGVRPGPHGDGAPYRTYVDDVAGQTDHVELLATYAGVFVPFQVDPTRPDRIPAIIEAAFRARGFHGRRSAVWASDLNGIWADPGHHYAENIGEVWRRVFRPHTTTT